MKSAITAIGIANPAYKRAQMETAEIISTGLDLKKSQKRLLKSVYRATGIEYRYSVLSDYCKNPGEFEFFPNNSSNAFPTTKARMQIYQDNALPLAIAAINNCIKSSDSCEINNITHLITVSCTGFYAPGLDIEIVQALQLSTSVKRTCINFMGCYGAFNALKVADSICLADEKAKVLIVCIEMCTLHFQNNFSLDNVISNAIFADGAAAVIIQQPQKKQKSFAIESFYCDIMPQTSKEMAWQVADQGFDIVLSAYVPEVIEKGIANFTENLFKQSHLSTKEIDFYAIHPGGLKILEACENQLNITAEDNRFSYQVLRDYGNMSSPTILFVLKFIWDHLQKCLDNKNIFACAFGPGLTLESMLLKFSGFME